MAELLGIVAGGAGLASLAIQILDDAEKIRELYAGIRDAPTEFQSLLDEIQLFGMLMSLFARESEQLKSNHEFAIAQRQVIRHCQSLHDELSPILARLASSLAGRKRAVSWISVKSIFQKRKIDQMLMKLERAKSTLVLARLLNLTPHPSVEQGSTQTEVISMSSNKSNIPHTKSPAKASSFIRCSSYHIGVGTLTIGHEQSRADDEGDSIAARFAFAPWFLDWAITITSRKHDGLLDIRLQPKCLVKANAPIFRACALGDKETVAYLISTGKASPSDTTLLGATPLMVAATWRRPEICRQLIDLGADTSVLLEEEGYLGVWQWNPLALACRRLPPSELKLLIFDDRPDVDYFYDSRADSIGDTRDTLRVLVEHGKVDVEQPVGLRIRGLCTDTALHYFDGSLDDYSWLSTEDKITLVGNDLQDFYSSLAIAQSRTGDLQHTLALMNRLPDLGQFATASLDKLMILDGLLSRLLFDPLVQEEKQELLKMMRRLLDAGVGIHIPNLATRTPLVLCAMVSLDKYIRYSLNWVLDSHCWSFESAATYCTERLKDWADFLKQSGQDLHEYVKMEKEHVNEWIKCFTGEFSRSDDEYFTSLIVAVKIFLWVNTTEERLEIRLVYASKRRRNKVPGEWVDEQSQESSLEDDQGWTYHFPDVGDDTSDFDYREEEEDERSSSCQDDDESGDESDDDGGGDDDEDNDAENPEIGDEMARES